MARPQFVSMEQIATASPQDVIQWHELYVNPGLVQLLKLIGFTRMFVRAEGTKLFERSGRATLDFLSGYGVKIYGHNPACILGPLDRYGYDAVNLAQASLSNWAGGLANNLISILPDPLQHVFFASTGTEAVEAAIKITRLATKRTVILSWEGGYHGKTYGSLSASGRERYKTPFEPLVPDMHPIRFNDPDAMAAAFRKYRNRIAAVIIEPIQGEGGVRIPSVECIRVIRDLCTRHGAALIFDEVQTGFCRTGTLFAFERFGVVPDVLCLGKALGGGIEAVSATVFSDEIWSRSLESPMMATAHTGTMNGRGRASIAACATLEELKRRKDAGEDLSDEVDRKGQCLMAGLKALQQERPELIKEVRGHGLLVGIEFESRGAKWINGLTSALSGFKPSSQGSELLGSMVAGRLLTDHDVLTAYTIHNPGTLRVEPSLLMSDKELRYFIEALAIVVTENRRTRTLVGRLARRHMPF